MMQLVETLREAAKELSRLQSKDAADNDRRDEGYSICETTLKFASGRC